MADEDHSRYGVVSDDDVSCETKEKEAADCSPPTDARWQPKRQFSRRPSSRHNELALQDKALFFGAIGS